MDNVSQYLQMMDLSGQAPSMQNIGGQRDLYNQNMTAIKTLGQQALSGKTASPLQSLADALRAQQKPGLGQMLDDKGNIVYDPKYGNINQSSVMQNPTYNPYENPI
jgi:type VI protein secretion system component VasK